MEEEADDEFYDWANQPKWRERVAACKPPWPPRDKALNAIVMARVQLLFEHLEVGRAATRLIVYEGHAPTVNCTPRLLIFNRAWVLSSSINEIADAIRFEMS